LVRFLTSIMRIASATANDRLLIPTDFDEGSLPMLQSSIGNKRSINPRRRSLSI